MLECSWASTGSSSGRGNVSEGFRRRFGRRRLDGGQFGAPAFFQFEDVVVFRRAFGPFEFFQHARARGSLETPAEHRENEGIVFAVPLYRPLHSAADLAIRPPRDP